MVIKMEHIRDIFISYKNDNAGNNFASRLTASLEKEGYGVYFNSHHQKGGEFPERLKESIIKCTDFVLIISQGCLDQIQKMYLTEPEKDKDDWISQEIIIAHENGKNIIPIVLENVTMPYGKDDWVNDKLKFLGELDYIFFTENYTTSPFLKLQDFLHSKKEKDDIYRNTFNDNPNYDVYDVYKNALSEAEKGSIAAMYKAGVMCFYGSVSDDGTKSERNFELAAEYFNKIIDWAPDLFGKFWGNPDIVSLNGVTNIELQNYVNSSHYFLAKMYYAGSLPREGQSYFESYKHRLSGEFDLSNAVQVAAMQQNGLGCAYNHSRVIEYYDKIISNGDDIAKEMYAKYMYKIGKYRESIEIFETMQYLSAEAAYLMGIMHRDGVHVFVDSDDPQKAVPPAPDYYKASYYLQEAADRNHSSAAFELALLNFRPFEKHRKNFPKALKYFSIAAESGNSEAMYMLGYMYENGHVGVNIEKAIECYEKAVNYNHPLASLQLALLYQQPERKNYHKAYQHALKSTNSGVAEAEFVLGTLLLYGRGCKCNINEAYHHFQNAESHGIFPASIFKKEIEAIRNNEMSMQQQSQSI